MTWEVKVHLWAARRFGKLIGVCKRAQIRMLIRAELLGWLPTDEEAEKLRIDRTMLFNYNLMKQARGSIRKQKQALRDIEKHT